MSKVISIAESTFIYGTTIGIVTIGLVSAGSLIYVLTL